MGTETIKKEREKKFFLWENRVFITLMVMCIAFVAREFAKSHDLHIIQPLIDAAQNERMDRLEALYQKDVEQMKSDIRALLLRQGVKLGHRELIHE